MYPKISFTINADFYRFEQWLEDFRTRTLPFNFKVMGKKSLAVISAPTFRLYHNGFRQHTIDAHFLYPDKENPNASIASGQISVIKLQVFEPSKNRTNITIECALDYMLPYYEMMLSRISEVWPEAKQSIDLHLRENKEHPDYLGLNKGKPKDSETQSVATKIPDIGWHREAVGMWNQGKTAKEISASFGGSPSERRIWNVLSELRKEFPHLIKRKKR